MVAASSANQANKDDMMYSEIFKKTKELDFHAPVGIHSQDMSVISDNYSRTESEAKATSVSQLGLGKFGSIKKLLGAKSRYIDTQKSEKLSMIGPADQELENENLEEVKETEASKETSRTASLVNRQTLEPEDEKIDKFMLSRSASISSNNE